MVTIKGYLEYFVENSITYVLMFLIMVFYSFLVIWNKDDVITILIMTFTFIFGYSFAEFQDYNFKKATKIDIDFRRKGK